MSMASAAAAERFQVSVSAGVRRADRYRGLGEAGTDDRSSPADIVSGKDTKRTERRIIAMRVDHRWYRKNELFPNQRQPCIP